MTDNASFTANPRDSLILSAICFAFFAVLAIIGFQFVIPAYHSDMALNGANEHQLAKNLSLNLYLLGVGSVVAVFAGVTNLSVALGTVFSNTLAADMEAKLG